MNEPAEYENNNLTTICPACNSYSTIIELSDAEKNKAIGLYDLYNFIGAIDRISKQYYCNNCGYMW